MSKINLVEGPTSLSLIVQENFVVPNESFDVTCATNGGDYPNGTLVLLKDNVDVQTGFKSSNKKELLIKLLI